MSTLERKLVTVLFADVSGSTALGETLDPERLKEVMDAFFDAMRPAIESEGGTVEKFIGDAVMAVFGVPVAHEDDATRAMRAALRMRRALDELNRSLLEGHGLSLAMRIGISMGDVVAVVTPRLGEGMVTGDAVNVAARLEQSAEPGEIRVSGRAARSARGFQLVEIGSLLLKGKEQPVHAFELIGEAQPDDRAWPAFAAPMVGRRREMTLLQSVYERVASEGHPHLVTIYGDPGVGKSRLVAELRSWAVNLDPPPMVVGGRCLPYGEGVTYSPLAEILKRHAGVLDSDPPRLAVQKIEVIGKELLSPEVSSDPGRAVAALCLTLGLQHPGLRTEEMEPRRIHVKILSAWRSYFSALGGGAPTIAVFEDIHWADMALLDLLEELADHVQGPLLFLAPARPELTGRRPGWGGGRWNRSSLLLEPLSSPEVDRLIDLLLEGGELPGAVRKKILERGGGNPFFVEEITRHLLEEGGMPPGDGEPSLAPPAVHISETADIPDTVQGVLAARMDLLGPFEKRALQSASVVGRVFWIGPLTRLLNAGQSEIEETLGHLEDRALVLTSLSSTMGGEREYSFKHVLTRDVAYESLPRRERAAAHAEVATWIEGVGGDRWREFVDQLAYHYGEAYRSAREQARTDPDRVEALRSSAFRYALTASEEARSKLVLDSAQRMAEAALELAAGPWERSQAFEALGEMYFLGSRGDLAWAALREAVDARVAGGVEGTDTELAGLCAKALEVVTRGRGAMRARLTEEEAAPYLEIGLHHLGPGDGEERARLLAVQSFWPYSFRDRTNTEEELKRARLAGEEAAAMAMRLERSDLASAALGGVAAFFLSRGLYGPMGEVVERRLELVDSLNDPMETGDIYAEAAWAAFHVGRYVDAAALADEGFRRAMPAALVMGLYCLDFRAVARCRLGEWDEFLRDVDLIGELLEDRRERPPGFASDHIAAAAFVHEVRGEPGDAGRMLRILDWLEGAEDRQSPGWAAWRALLLSRRGEFEAARELLARPETGFQWGRGYRLEALCDVIAEQAAWEDAPQVIEEARRHSAEAGLVALPLYADRLEGSMAMSRGDFDGAMTLLERAGEGFSELRARWEAARTAVKLAETLAGAGHRDRAAGVAREAIPLLEELRSLRELEEARRLAADT